MNNQFISKYSLENKISELNRNYSANYSKKRVAGSNLMSYIMHPRSKCMPGNQNIFVSNSNFNSKYKDENDMVQIRQNFIRNRYKESQTPIGVKYTQNHLDYFTYKTFSPISDESLYLTINQAYRQVFGNLALMESERCVDLERRLRNGDITVREFIRGLVKSDLYRKYYFENVNQIRCIKLNFMHLLGRPLINNNEIEKHIKIITSFGFNSHVDSLIDSIEYEEFFGEDIVPFQRFWNSPCGATTSSFVKTVLFRNGFASSDSVNL